MSPQTWTRLRVLFATHPIMAANETPSTTEIVQAAADLKTSFPNAYVEFVTEFGAGMVGAYPIFGLRPVSVFDAYEWSVIKKTKSFRQSPIAGTDDWVVFSEDHAGNPVAFDSDGVVWIFDHDFGGVARLADSFEDYIYSQCLKDA